VRVNVDQLVIGDMARSGGLGAKTRLPRPPAPSGPVGVGLPAIPAQVLRDPSRTSESSVEAALLAQQGRALGSFVAGLQVVDETEAKVLRVKNQQDLKNTLSQLTDEFSAQLKGLFARFAEQRLPKVIELSNLVGYPDPNPTSTPPRRPVTPYAQHQLDEAKRVRGELAAIDHDFEQEKNILLNQLKLDSEMDRANLETEIKDYQAELDRRAARLAAEEVPTNAKALGLRLVHPEALVVSAIPARKLAIPGEPPLATAPQVPSEQIPRGFAERLRLIRQELAIWLALNRCRESPAGRDATQEFQKWREKYKAGL
jgi:hypothetical protein